jgi:GT2 family glycosyltransferase
MTQKKTRVVVVMLTVNQRETTLRALASLSPEDRRRSHVLVWDNGSIDGTLEAVRERFPDVHLRRHDSNLGVASGRNAAAAYAMERFAPTHLLFVDNDLVFTPGFVDALLQPFMADGRVGQTQAKLRFLHEPELINDGGGCRISFWRGWTRPVGFREPDRGQYDSPAPCISCGGAMMTRADVFRELDGFDTSFDPFGPEDLDFSLRLQKRAYHSLYVPRAMAYHEVSHTFGGAQYTAQYARIKAQHWLRFLGRHGSLPEKIGFALVGAPVIALRMALREGRKRNPGALFGSVWGVVAGLAPWRSARSTAFSRERSKARSSSHV